MSNLNGTDQSFEKATFSITLIVVTKAKEVVLSAVKVNLLQQSRQFRVSIYKSLNFEERILSMIHSYLKFLSLQNLNLTAAAAKFVTAWQVSNYILIALISTYLLSCIILNLQQAGVHELRICTRHDVRNVCG